MSRMVTMFGRSDFARSGRAVAALAVLAGTAVIGTGTGQAASPQGTVGIEKSVVGLTGPATPGTGFSYQLTASCSSLTVACVGATVSDVIPAGLNVTDLPTSSRNQTVTFNAATRRLTVTFTQPLPPPNPVGSTGLLAGSVSKVFVGVQLPANTSAADGSTINNTATIDADNAAPASDSASVAVSIPRRLTPVASKSWPDSDSIAQSGAQSTVTLGIRNNSSVSAQVSSLTVTDTSTATFDTHDLMSVGPVVRFPAGADRVAVGVCTQPVGTPCAAGQWITGPAVAGPTLTLPGGVSAGSVTGVRFTFTNSAGTALPIDPTGGRVSFGLQLRDTTRSTGAALDPANSQNGQNCADPSATDPVAGAVTGAPTCVNFSVLSRATTVGVAKRYFPDTDGSFGSNGSAVAGQHSPVSALTSATNTSKFAVPSISITEPSASSASDFAALDVSSLRLGFPAGATSATVAVACRNGAPAPATVTVTAPPALATLPSTGCSPADPPASITVTYHGVNAQGDATIASGAVATLGVHGSLNDAAAAGEISNCADAVVTSPAGGQGSASGVGCANVDVVAPTSGVTGRKTTNSTSLVSGVPVKFSVRATNSGTLPQETFTVTDPPSPSAAANPFNVIRITTASFFTAPSAVAAQFQLQLFDSRTATWVKYVGSDAALLNAAHGIRAVLLSPTMPAGASVTISYSAEVRDDAVVGATIKNCMLSTATATGATTAPLSACAATQTVTPPSTTGAVHKTIVPPTLSRSLTGVTPPTSQVRLQVENTGNIGLKQIVLTDTDNAFFDAVNLTTIDGVNFPPGADRVQVDACTTGCATNTYVGGSPGTTAALPAGVPAADVQGLRITFTSSTGGYALTPGSNFPTTGACPNASVCFHVAPRVNLRSAPTVAVPAALADTATAAGESQLQPPGATYPFGPASATLTLVAGTPQLDVDKTPATSAAGAGDPIPFTLNVRNSGSGIVRDLVITDPIPSGLVFDDALAGDGGKPYFVTSSVPAGTPALPTPTFAIERGDATDPDLVTAVRWTFPDYDFLPGASVAITFQATLAPGFEAGSTETNVFGAGSSDPVTQTALGCLINSTRDGQTVDGSYGPGRYCTSSASVLSRGGTDVDAQKWVTGNAALGFYNTVTGQRVVPGDVACPVFTAPEDGRKYTRYPCVAQVLAGQTFDFRLRVINVGNTAVTAVRLADGLPHTGDTGVKLTDEQRDTAWNERPVLTAAPTLNGPGTAQFSYTADEQVCTSELQRPPTSCASGSWTPSYSLAALGFQAVVSFPATLPPGGSFSISVPMQAPPTLTNPTDAMPIAWNSFAHTDFVLEPGSTSPVQLPLVEPPKVGVALPFGTLVISKVIDGDLSDPSLVGPFTADYSCTVTPTGGTPVVVAAGSGSFAVGSPLTVPLVPVGAQCAVWESDTGGGQSDHTTQATAVDVTIAATPGTATGVELANNFSDTDLQVTKRVVNGGAGPYSFQMTCSLAGRALDLPAGYAAFTLTADQTKLFTLPTGSICTITEVDLPSLDTVFYGNSTTPVPVTLTSDQAQTITNQFPLVEIAPPPPPTTSSNSTSTPSGPSSSTNSPPQPSEDLASTGSEIRGQLTIVAICWVLGAGLVLAVRRRNRTG